MLDTLQGQRGRPSADVGSQYLALLALGEIGRTSDLSRFDGVQEAVTGALEGSSSDELRAAASHALGGLAVGSTSAFLPFILQQIQAQVCILQSMTRCSTSKSWMTRGKLHDIIGCFHKSGPQQPCIAAGISINFLHE